jgi:hypothetical protein
VAWGKASRSQRHIKPEEAAQIAKITVDDKDTPPASDFEMGDAEKKRVIIIVKAAGFKDLTYEGDIEGIETKFEFTMTRKAKPAPSGKRPGGLVDI